ncbi:MAG: TonB-dependent receptor [Bacteroidia bacterium]|nr:TonB-dependent receptor [Bacteroidia bacterium]
MGGLSQFRGNNCFQFILQKLQNPIGKQIRPGAVNNEQVFINVDQADVYGIELELRKNLGFISSMLNDFNIGTNVSLTASQVNIEPSELANIRSVSPSREDNRPLFGQSPFLINAYLNYDNYESGWSANANFNIFGERLVVAVGKGAPDIFEQPRASLDITVSKRLGERFSLRFRGTNLINPEYKLTQDFKGNENVYEAYRVGRNFSLGLSYAIE